MAEQFRVLEAIAPGASISGLGRAPGSDGRTAFALNPQAETAADHFPAQVRDLLAWLAGEPLVEGHPFRDIRAQPGGPTVPEVWILGSSDYGAQVAAYFGLPFCFAHFITDGRGVDQAMALYREDYRPSERFPKPHGALCVWAMAAETPRQRPRGCSARARCGGWAATAACSLHYRRPRKQRAYAYSEPERCASNACVPARDLGHAGGGGGEVARTGGGAWGGRNRHSHHAARPGGTAAFVYTTGTGVRV